MARSQSRIAGLAAAVALGGCFPSDELPPDRVTPRQVVARMRVFAKEQDIVGQARGGTESTLHLFDLDKGECHNKTHNGSPYRLGMDVIWRPEFSYKPDEQYYLIGYFCMEDLMYYYRFREKNATKDVILGPYFMGWNPTPQQDPVPVGEPGNR